MRIKTNAGVLSAWGLVSPTASARANATKVNTTKANMAKANAAKASTARADDVEVSALGADAANANAIKAKADAVKADAAKGVHAQGIDHHNDQSCGELVLMTVLSVALFIIAAFLHVVEGGALMVAAEFLVHVSAHLAMVIMDQAESDTCIWEVPLVLL